MNREEKLEGLEFNYEPTYTLYLYLTGKVLLEYGLMLYVDNDKKYETVLGPLIQVGLEPIASFLESKGFTPDQVGKLVVKSKWVNRSHFVH